MSIVPITIINKSQLMPAIKRWLKLSAEERNRLMKDNQYVCYMRLPGCLQTAEVIFGNPEGTYDCIHVRMPRIVPGSTLVDACWTYNYKHHNWSVVVDDVIN